jgi:hypothetical protein
MTLALRVALAALALTATASAQHVWTVDAALGPGSDFQDLPAAVAAAADGDTLIVRSGWYSELVLDNKALTVAALPGTSMWIFGAKVLNLDAQKEVLLVNLAVASLDGTGLLVSADAGEVLVDGCSLVGANGPNTYSTGWGFPGVEVFDSARVTLTGCTLTGGDGRDYATRPWAYGGGGDGGYIHGDSEVALYGCQIQGGEGGSDDDEDYGGMPGGPAVYVATAEITVVGCTLLGGPGGDGGNNPDPWSYTTCGDGGYGGDGIQYAKYDTEPPPAAVHEADNSFVPGLGGQGGDSSCAAGLPGVLFYIAPTIPDSMPIHHVGLTLTSPILETDSATLQASGPAGTAVLLAVGSQPDFAFDPALFGVVTLDPFGLTFVGLGTLDATGVLSLTFPNAVDVLPGQALTFFAQAIGIDAQGFIELGSPVSHTILGV